MGGEIYGVKVACYDVGNLMDGRVRVRPSGGSVFGAYKDRWRRSCVPCFLSLGSRPSVCVMMTTQHVYCIASLWCIRNIVIKYYSAVHLSWGCSIKSFQNLFIFLLVTQLIERASKGPCTAWPRKHTVFLFIFHCSTAEWVFPFAGPPISMTGSSSIPFRKRASTLARRDLITLPKNIDTDQSQERSPDDRIRTHAFSTAFLVFSLSLFFRHHCAAETIKTPWTSVLITSFAWPTYNIDD